MNKKLPITVAVLLGGESSRFGSPKAFLPWNDKVSLAAHLAKTAWPLGSRKFFWSGRMKSRYPKMRTPSPSSSRMNPAFRDLSLVWPGP